MATASSHHSTPVKANADGTDRFSCTVPQADANRAKYNREMAGQYVGPMPHKDFFKEFMPAVTPTMPTIDFDDVPTGPGALEKEMYPKIVSLDIRVTCNQVLIHE